MKRQWIKDEDGCEFLIDISELKDKLNRDKTEVSGLIQDSNETVIEQISNKDSDRYCTICGEKTIGKSAGYFSQNTGEEKMNYCCPSLLCGHDGNYHERKNYKLFYRTCIKCRDKIINFDNLSIVYISILIISMLAIVVAILLLPVRVPT